MRLLVQLYITIKICGLGGCGLGGYQTYTDEQLQQGAVVTVTNLGDANTFPIVFFL